MTGFKQSAAVTLELRFNTWDAVYIARPNTRENGFIPVLNTAEALQAIEQLKVAPRFAAVVVGYNYDERQVYDIGVEWFTRLSALGFERVVALRGSENFPIAGLPIVYDSAISSGHDTLPRGRPYAATPTAPRADVAHSPVAPVR